MSATAAAPKPHRDNLFGVCHAIADAFGFDPLYLRLAFLVGMLVNFPAAALAYALAGVVVLAGVGAEKAGRRLRHGRGTRVSLGA